MQFRAAVLTLTLTTLSPVLAAAPAAHAAAGRSIDYVSWDSGAALKSGTMRAVRVARGKLRLDAPTSTRRVAGATYERGSWTSPWTSPGFGLTELVPSWDAKAPEGTFIEVQVRGRGLDGRRSSWDRLGRWAAGDREFRRSSQGRQADDLARVATDTWVAQSPLTSWQLRVTLHRRVGTSRTPRVDVIGAVASAIAPSTSVRTSRPGVARGVTLPVPQLSQMIHQGHFPAYGGGGEAWCSPTSTAMVLAYYDALPPIEDAAWVGPGHADAVVDDIARQTFDYRYDGTGNWPFNTAYAATRTDKAFVTRFASLRGVERLVAAGIPTITSLTFSSGQLSGAPISSTNGHLLVVVGFTADGDVVVNDPAAGGNSTVRRVYDRAQFENAWLKRGSAGGSGGLGFVIHDRAHPLPPRTGATPW